MIGIFNQLAIAGILCALVEITGAQTVPSLANYQGWLLNPDGSPLATADYQLTFNVCESTLAAYEL